MKSLNKAMQLYLVTDSSYETKGSLPQLVEQAIKGGVTLVQLREKDLDTLSFIKKAKELKQITDKYNVPLIINDNLEVALQTNAAGLHIGQDDLQIAKARKFLGNNKVLGVSANTVKQAIEAEKLGADYLGVGAIFQTATKKDALEVPLEKLKEITNAVNLPICAIGGIGLGNLHLLQGSNIDGVAVVSAILGAQDITEAAKQLFEKTIIFSEEKLQ